MLMQFSAPSSYSAATQKHYEASFWNTVASVKRYRFLQDSFAERRRRLYLIRAVFDGGLEGFDPPQEVADPRKFCRTSLGGRL